MGDAPQPAGLDADGDEEPAAGSAGPLLSRVDVGAAGCVGHQGRSSGGRASSPTRTGSRRSGWLGLFGSPPNRGLRVRRSAAERLVAAARAALPAPEAAVARQVLADDLGLLAELDAQIGAAEAEMAKLLPDTPFAALITVPGWGTIRAGNYGAAVGDPGRWPGARQLYRASGLSPAQYESAGKRRDGSISREGSVALRRALIDLGIGLWRSDPAARRYGQQLRARGKKGGVIGCAMAHRANKIAYAMVRDQSGYDPGRWA